MLHLALMNTKDVPRDPVGSTPTSPELVELPRDAKLPVVLPPAQIWPQRRLWSRRATLLLILLLTGVGAGYWWLHSRPLLPPGIASGNGRLEANQIDIDTKFAGRIAKLFVDEGDMVQAGQVLALMDTQDLQASLKKAQAVVSQAEQALNEAKANLVSQQTQVALAKQQLDRTSTLVPKGYATVELLDHRRQEMNAALAAQDAAAAKVGETEHALDAARHDTELYRINIRDNALTAPVGGRIQYRVANVGEVLAAGGKVFTMLDTADVYMDIYLPTAEAGRIRLGSDARILLDAYPAHPIPAKVVFIASQAQFTPKTVETKEERDKLMFRIRVRIDPERLRTRAEMVRSGLPGTAYVRTDPNATWPRQLEASASS